MAQEDKDKTKEEEKIETEEVQESVVEDVVEEPKEEKEEEAVEESKEEEAKDDVSEESVENVVEDTVEEESGEESEDESKEEELPQDSGDTSLPEFRVGDTIKVFYKIIEGDKVRTQPYQGIVISRKGTGISKTFTVRKIGADNIGVERIFPLASPNIEKIAVIKRGKVRRAKLYYLRGRIGRKATQIKEKIKSK